MVKDLLAATRYAEALFEIARSLHEDEAIEAELESLSEALRQSPGILKFLESPRLGFDAKREFLVRIYQERSHPIYEVLLNFFMLLFKKDRFHLIHEISKEFRRIADEAQGQGVAVLKIAAPIDAASEARLVSRLEKIAGHKIEVKKEIDPSLVGGVFVRVKNKVMDGSVKNRIHILKKELLKRKIF